MPQSVAEPRFTYWRSVILYALRESDNTTETVLIQNEIGINDNDKGVEAQWAPIGNPGEGKG